ncbi:hypothetical protein ABIC76_003599 [Ralstonia sp. 1138]
MRPLKKAMDPATRPQCADVQVTEAMVAELLQSSSRCRHRYASVARHFGCRIARAKILLKA